MPISQPEVARVTSDEIYNVAAAANDYIDRTGNLPSSLAAKNGRIGTGSLFALFSAVYLDLKAGRLRTDYEVPSLILIPKRMNRTSSNGSEALNPGRSTAGTSI